MSRIIRGVTRASSIKRQSTPKICFQCGNDFYSSLKDALLHQRAIADHQRIVSKGAATSVRVLPTNSGILGTITLHHMFDGSTYRAGNIELSNARMYLIVPDSYSLSFIGNLSLVFFSTDTVLYSHYVPNVKAHIELQFMNIIYIMRDAVVSSREVSSSTQVKYTFLSTDFEVSDGERVLLFSGGQP